MLGKLLQPAPADAPDFMRGLPWQRKSANTVLAAWAQMRHTWALQTKEIWCILGFKEYPKPIGFVEPVPEFYRWLDALVLRFTEYLSELDVLEPDRAALARHLRMEAESCFERARSYKAEGPSGTHNCRQFEKLGQEHLAAAAAIDSATDDQLLWAQLSSRDPQLKRRWAALHSACLTLRRLADKQLNGEPQDDVDRRFILQYGKMLSDLMFYEGDTADSPDDDAPRVCEVGFDPRSGQRLQVGIGRPQAIYVLYPTETGPVLCRGAVLPYSQCITERPLTNEE